MQCTRQDKTLHTVMLRVLVVPIQTCGIGCLASSSWADATLTCHLGRRCLNHLADMGWKQSLGPRQVQLAVRCFLVRRHQEKQHSDSKLSIGTWIDNAIATINVFYGCWSFVSTYFLNKNSSGAGFPGERWDGGS